MAGNLKKQFQWLKIETVSRIPSTLVWQVSIIMTWAAQNSNNSKIFSIVVNANDIYSANLLIGGVVVLVDVAGSNCTNANN